MAEEAESPIGRLAPEALADAFDRFTGAVGIDWQTFAQDYMRGLSKSFGAPEPTGKAIHADPYRWGSAGLGYYERPSSISWTTLQRMATTPIIGAIIRTRTRQVQAFAAPQENEYLPGFQVRLRERKKSPTRAETRMMEDLTQFLVQCGTIADNRQILTRSGFSAFTAAIISDSLTFDQACAEIIPTRGSRLSRDGARTPARLKWVDASTIRVADTGEDELDDDDYTTPRFVQVVNGEVTAEFEPARLMFGVRNPTTSIYQLGYGFSEQEMLSRVLTAWLNVFDRNFRYFTQGYNAKGFLNFKQESGTPALSEPQMYGVRREIQMLASGVTGAHRLPIINSPGVEYVALGSEVQDAQWLGFSDQGVKLISAMYSMDPAEINHAYGNTGQTSAMGGTPMAEKVEESKARGLVPLVKNHFDWMSRWVIQQIDPDFEVVPTGTQPRDEDAEIQLDKDRVSSIMTVNEVRARRDLPPLKKAGDVILNPAYLQALGMDQGDGQGGGDDAGDQGDEPMDMASLFDQPPGSQPQQPAAPTGQQPGGAAPAPVVQQSQPLEASQARRRQRTTITL